MASIGKEGFTLITKHNVKKIPTKSFSSNSVLDLDAAQINQIHILDNGRKWLIYHEKTELDEGASSGRSSPRGGL